MPGCVTGAPPRTSLGIVDRGGQRRRRLLRRFAHSHLVAGPGDGSVGQMDLLPLETGLQRPPRETNCSLEGYSGEPFPEQGRTELHQCSLPSLLATKCLPSAFSPRCWWDARHCRPPCLMAALPTTAPSSMTASMERSLASPRCSTQGSFGCSHTSSTRGRGTPSSSSSFCDQGRL